MVLVTNAGKTSTGFSVEAITGGGDVCVRDPPATTVSVLPRWELVEA